MRTTLLTILFLLSTSLQAKDCTPTPHLTTGTHYKPVTVNKINIGKGVVVKGVSKLGKMVNIEISFMLFCMPIKTEVISSKPNGRICQYRTSILL